MADPENPDYYPEAVAGYKPAGDWSNFYGDRFGDDTPDSPGISNDRLGTIPAYREEPLQEPYILWDSRDLTLASTVVVNHGTAGAHYDLKLGGAFNETPRHPYDDVLAPFNYVYGYKTLNWDNSYATTPSAPGGFPTGESEIGGDTCEGAYTWMIPISPHYKLEDVIEAEQAARGANSLDGYIYTEFDFLSNFDAADGGGTNLDMNFLGDNNNSFFDLFHEWYDSYNYMQWFPSTPAANIPPGDPLNPWNGSNITGKLITICTDPWAGTYEVWIDELLVQIFDMWGDYTPPDAFNTHWSNFYDWVMDCRQNASGLNPGTFKELFLYFYGHEGGPKYVNNAAWRGCPGLAMFRGKPSPADIRYWKNYFMPEGQAYQPTGMRYNIRRPSGVGSGFGPHSDTFIVPDNGFDPENGMYPMDNIVMNISPAGGGGSAGVGLIDGLSQWAKFAVSPGDVITVQLGGGGQIYRQNGLGGWPDGGIGGWSTASGQYGGGGGGSTKIFRNGTLYIHMPGCGGGANHTTGGGPSFIEAGQRVSSVEQEGWDAYNADPNGPPLDAYDGQGATASAPGAGGLGGGTAGVGSTGGNGTVSSLSNETGGGGGGGGVKGGGGGGFDGNLSRGGGAGSWFVHPNVTIYSYNGVGSGGISGTGADAYVDIYYW